MRKNDERNLKVLIRQVTDMMRLEVILSKIPPERFMEFFNCQLYIKDKNTPLILAVYHNQLEKIEFILANTPVEDLGTMLSTKNAYNRIAFDYAETSAAKRILNEYQEIYILHLLKQDFNKMTPEDKEYLKRVIVAPETNITTLNAILSKIPYESLMEFLNCKADNEDKYTPLISAVSNNQLEKIEFILANTPVEDLGAMLSTKNSYNKPAFDHAKTPAAKSILNKYQKKCILHLLEKDFNNMTPEDKEYLKKAIQAKETDIMILVQIISKIPHESLMEFFNCKTNNKYEDTPLILAVYYNQLEKIKLILTYTPVKDLGAMLSAKDTYNKIAFDYAKTPAAKSILNEYQEKYIPYLLEKDFNTMTPEDKGYLKMAIQTKKTNITRLDAILSKIPHESFMEFFNCKTNNKYKDTPLILAVYSNQPEKIKFILENTPAEHLVTMLITKNADNKIAFDYAESDEIKSILIEYAMRGLSSIANIDETVERFANFVEHFKLKDLEFMQYIDSTTVFGDDVPEKYRDLVANLNGKGFHEKLKAELKKIEDDKAALKESKIEALKRENASQLRRLGGNQGIHGGGIDQSCKNAIDMLTKKYPEASANSAKYTDEIKEYINTLLAQCNNPGYTGPTRKTLEDALKGLKVITGESAGFNRKSTSAQPVAAMVWLAIQDADKLTGPMSEGIEPKALQNALKEQVVMQLEAVKNAYGNGLASCIKGAKNRMIQVLDRCFNGIEIDYGLKGVGELERIENTEILKNKLIIKLIEIIGPAKLDYFLSYDNSDGKTIIDQGEKWKEKLSAAEEVIFAKYPLSRAEFFDVYRFRDLVELDNPTILLKPEFDFQKHFIDFCIEKIKLDGNFYSQLDKTEEYKEEFFKYIGNKGLIPENWGDKGKQEEIIDHALKVFNKRYVKEQINKKIHQDVMTCSLAYIKNAFPKDQLDITKILYAQEFIGAEGSTKEALVNLIITHSIKTYNFDEETKQEVLGGIFEEIFAEGKVYLEDCITKRSQTLEGIIKETAEQYKYKDANCTEEMSTAIMNQLNEESFFKATEEEDRGKFSKQVEASCKQYLEGDRLTGIAKLIDRIKEILGFKTYKREENILGKIQETHKGGFQSHVEKLENAKRDGSMIPVKG